MIRYDKLLVGITKGLNIDNKTNVVFGDWTPHNIRRLIVGVDRAIIQYHVTGGKFTSLTHVIDYSSLVNSDCNIFRENPNKLKSLISVLTDVRICSAVEEIVFCTSKYPQPLLMHDCNLDKISSGINTSIKNRFPRLAKVYVLNVDVSSIEDIVRENVQPEKLLYDVLSSKGIRGNVIAKVNDEWYAGNTKFWNSGIYTMDKEDGTLYKRLQSVADKYAEEINKSKILNSESNRKRKIAESHLMKLDTIMNEIDDLHEQLSNLVGRCGIVTKAKWGKYVMDVNIISSFHKLISGIQGKVDKICWLDVYNIIKDNCPDIIPLFNTLYVAIKQKEYYIGGDVEVHNQYKKELLLSDTDSCKLFSQLCVSFMVHLCQCIYAGVVRCLAVTTPKYVATNYKNWGMSGGDLIAFTKTTAEHVNNIAGVDYTHSVLEAIGAKFILESDYSVRSKYEDAKIAIGILDTYLVETQHV